jgi:hypothetical protein
MNSAGVSDPKLFSKQISKSIDIAAEKVYIYQVPQAMLNDIEISTVVKKVLTDVTIFV